MNETIFVIGNGPSLRGFDFHKLSPFPTLGMNAAYRYWDRINWYPTHYCCLDSELINTHHIEIKRLVEESLVQSAFVAGNFFELHPECISDSRYISLDQVVPYWFAQRGKQIGRPFIEHIAFKTVDASKITTGAYSVRYAAFLGFPKIALIGIDLNYVELIDEAKEKDGIALVIKETPKYNPNYFFDDYQRVGDTYNIPNPSVHKGNLHLESFRVLRDDYYNMQFPVRIINCNPDSLLNEQAIFPYEPQQLILGGSKLGSILVPCNASEVEQILANLKLWAQPGFAPYLGPVPKFRPKLIFVFNNKTAQTQSERIDHAISEFDLAKFFSDVEFHFLDLYGECDLYVRTYDKPVGLQGYKAGPNNQFFASMKVIQDKGYYTFLIETDCIPIRPDWLRILCNTVDNAEPFWIMGSPYRGIGTLTKKFSRHINGNAIYAAGDKQFQKFIDEFWRPNHERIVSHLDNRIAYDCSLEMTFYEAKSDVEDDMVWRKWKDVAHLIRYTTLLQNISAKKDIDHAHPDLVHDILKHSPYTLFIHSQAVANVVSKLVDSQNNIVPNSLRPNSPHSLDTTVNRVNGLVFDTIHRTGSIKSKQETLYLLPGSSENYVCCVYVGIVKQGDQVKSEVEFVLDQSCKLSVILCRNGNGGWEASREILRLKAGNHKVNLTHVFRNSHPGIRIQIGSEDITVGIQILSSSVELNRPVKV